MKIRTTLVLSTAFVAASAASALAQPTPADPTQPVSSDQPQPPPPPADVQGTPDIHHMGGGNGAGTGDGQHMGSDHNHGNRAHDGEGNGGGRKKGRRGHVDRRPSVMSIGIGAGYNFPTELKAPNIVSARLRLPSGLMFEPRLQLSTTGRTQSAGGMESKDATTNLGFGTMVYVPLAKRGNVDLNALGAVQLARNVDDPQGDNNNVTRFNFGLGYGVGMVYWFRKHWTVSMLATNELVSYSSTETEMGNAAASEDSTISAGLVWNPQVSLLVHLHF